MEGTSLEKRLVRLPTPGIREETRKRRVTFTKIFISFNNFKIVFLYRKRERK